MGEEWIKHASDDTISTVIYFDYYDLFLSFAIIISGRSEIEKLLVRKVALIIPRF